MARIGVDDALTALGLGRTGAVALHGSRSGAGVHRLQVEGRDTVLKVGRADDPSARRELDAYLTLTAALPVRTPTLLAHAETDDAVVLLLSAHGPPLPAVAWTTRDWLRFADDLARLHEAVPPDNQSPAAPNPTERLRSSDPDDLLGFWARSDERALLPRVLADTDALAAAVAALPATFIHGDCHPENLLHDPDGFVWADWQSAGLGSPTSDLAFPSVRVTPAGVRVPYELLLTRYADVRGLDAVLIGRAVLAAELAVFVAQWPPFATYNSAEGIDRVHDRVVELARQWLDAGPR